MGVALAGSGGQSSRLGDLFRDWQRPLRRFLAHQRAGSEADIDDIAQEVFLRLLRYDRAEIIEDPQAYLFRMASNVNAEWATRSSRRLPHDSAWLTDLVDALTPEQELQSESFNAQLKEAIGGLPPRTRDILRLHFGENMTRDHVAEQLGVSRKIVKRDLARAYALLRHQLVP